MADATLPAVASVLRLDARVPEVIQEPLGPAQAPQPPAAQSQSPLPQPPLPLPSQPAR
jgi:hypothetical protein